ncbi:putative palmitoyltransferase zdhhc4, partial [Cichlidogyrus casuarinus]
MEILFLFALQFLLFLLILVCFVFRDSQLVRFILSSLSRWSKTLLPRKLIDLANRLYIHLYFKRNKVFFNFYIILVLMGNAATISVTMPNLWNFETLITFGLLALHLLALKRLSNTDPGVVTSINVETFRQVYGAEDGACKYCSIDRRPKRSKHCLRCDVCVHRFDHHCVWTDCCVGGCNIGRFIFWLLTILLMLTNTCFLLYADLYIYTV